MYQLDNDSSLSIKSGGKDGVNWKKWMLYECECVHPKPVYEYMFKITPDTAQGDMEHDTEKKFGI